jgi:hypothetical protein
VYELALQVLWEWARQDSNLRPTDYELGDASTEEDRSRPERQVSRACTGVGPGSTPPEERCEDAPFIGDANNNLNIVRSGCVETSAWAVDT